MTRLYWISHTNTNLFESSQAPSWPVRFTERVTWPATDEREKNIQTPKTRVFFSHLPSFLFCSVLSPTRSFSLLYAEKSSHLFSLLSPPTNCSTYLHHLSFSILLSLEHSTQALISGRRRTKKPSTMDSLSSVSPSLVLPPTPSEPLCPRRRQLVFPPCGLQTRSCCPRLYSLFGLPCSPEISRRRWRRASSRLSGGGAAEDEEENDDGSEEVERALHLDGTIPGTSDEFVKRVSSRAYDMRRHLQQSFDSSSYDGACGDIDILFPRFY